MFLDHHHFYYLLFELKYGSKKFISKLKMNYSTSCQIKAANITFFFLNVKKKNTIFCGIEVSMPLLIVFLKCHFIDYQIFSEEMVLENYDGLVAKKIARYLIVI